MLVWHKRDDGWWEAPAPPIRVDKKIARMRCPPGTEPTDAGYWVEIGGTYFIGEYRKDEYRGFRVGCQPKGGGCLSAIKITGTLGDARVEAEMHYLDWQGGHGRDQGTRRCSRSNGSNASPASYQVGNPGWSVHRNLGRA